jgi:hypothetical protein
MVDGGSAMSTTHGNPFIGRAYEPDFGVPSGPNCHSASMERALSWVETDRDWGGEARLPQLMLVRAERAGYGKTRLLAALAGELERRGSASVFWLDARDAGHDLGGVMRVLVSAPQFKVASRAFLAEGMARLIGSGVIPASDRERAMREMRVGAQEIFDLGAQGANLGRDWVRHYFGQVLPELIGVWKAAGINEGIAREMLERYFLMNGGREGYEGETWGDLESLVRSARSARQWCVGLVATYAAWRRRVVFLIDDLDCHHRDEGAARALGICLIDLGSLGGAVRSVVAANDDVWLSTFRSGLPSAYLDRIEERTEHLLGLGVVAAKQLIEGRLDGSKGERVGRFWGGFDLAGWFAGGRLLSAREILRLASERWERLGGEPTGEQGDIQDQRAIVGEVLGESGATRVGTIGMGGDYNGLFGSSGEHVDGGRQVAALSPGERFHQLRHHAFHLREGLVTLEELRSVLVAAGKGFPVIYWEFVEVPGTGGQNALRWRFDHSEVLYGLVSPDDERFWRRLLEYASGRAALARAAGAVGHAGGKLKGFVKCVGFAPADDLADPEDLGFSWVELTASGALLDRVLLDRETSAAIRAANWLIQERGIEGEASGVLGVVARELEAFWRRLTRPLGTVSQLEGKEASGVAPGR